MYMPNVHVYIHSYIYIAYVYISDLYDVYISDV